ncbi:nucleoporin-like protein 2 isoform X4 [Neopelma chrysocephalum]|uniref:nucleoporin-like protein 2 isoform X4 n=1 Tax=Neopelma chrysocephalum TaxID=114329 RepID=UPI000FCCF63E|nr:nucleoporin-like protein 2 isoform X4 [Neopelma chrysocephalum]
MEGDCKYESIFLEVLTAPILAGFSDVLPEELRLEYYNCRAKNIIGNYINAVQWKNHLLQLKASNAPTKTISFLLSRTQAPNHRLPLDWEDSKHQALGSQAFL